MTKFTFLFFLFLSTKTLLANTAKNRITTLKDRIPAIGHLFVNVNGFDREKLKEGMLSSSSLDGAFKSNNVKLCDDDILKSESFFKSDCTVSLISSRQAITAAHCFKDLTWKNNMDPQKIIALAMFESKSGIHVAPAYIAEAKLSRFGDYAVLNLLTEVKGIKPLSPGIVKKEECTQYKVVGHPKGVISQVSSHSRGGKCEIVESHGIASIDIQTTDGMSGSPVLNKNNQIVGIVSSMGSEIKASFTKDNLIKGSGCFYTFSQKRNSLTTSFDINGTVGPQPVNHYISELFESYKVMSPHAPQKYYAIDHVMRCNVLREALKLTNAKIIDEAFGMNLDLESVERLCSGQKVISSKYLDYVKKAFEAVYKGTDVKTQCKNKFNYYQELLTTLKDQSYPEIPECKT